MGKRVENLYACDLNGSSSLHSRYYMLLCLIMALCMNISNKKNYKGTTQTSKTNMAYDLFPEIYM